MRNFLAQYNLLAVSAKLKESAINTEQALDTSMLIDMATVLDVDPRREDNGNELTGKEEPDSIYDLGMILDGKTMSFPKAQAQHFGFGLSFALGLSTPAAWGGGYKHAILPTSAIDLPSFTAAMRLGKTINKRRIASNFIDTVAATFAKDSWAKLDLGVKGTGKYTDTVYEESVTAAYNATSLVLAANGVQGSSASERLDNVHRIRVEDPDTSQWVEVSYSVVSADTPAAITIEAPGGVATSVTYKVLYIPTEPAWATFPSRVSESPLRVTQLALIVGGKWSGSAFLGGRTLSTEIDSITYNLNNQSAVEYRVGGTGAYANYMIRGGRMQSLALNREMREFILQNAILKNEYFGVYMKATGAEFEAGKNYYVEGIFPRCGVLKAPVSVNGKIIAEAGDLKILEDDTYGSCIWNVANMVDGYAQAA